MLFDKLSLKVVGESIAVSVLIGTFGTKGFEPLLEQAVIEFLLWKVNVVFLVDNIPGVDGMASIAYNGPAYIDPEQPTDAECATWPQTA